MIQSVNPIISKFEDLCSSIDGQDCQKFESVFKTFNAIDIYHSIDFLSELAIDEKTPIDMSLRIVLAMPTNLQANTFNQVIQNRPRISIQSIARFVGSLPPSYSRDLITKKVVDTYERSAEVNYLVQNISDRWIRKYCTTNDISKRYF